jgi:broad specificity phosphatase PhoE
MTVVLLVRHGQTEANQRGYWQGWEDNLLTPVGHAQARAVARRIGQEFAPTVVYSSSLQRALQTAKPITEAVGCPLIPHDDLRELNFGEINGLTIAEFGQQYPELFDQWKDKANLDFVWPGGESRREFFTRVWRAVDDIVAAHPKGEVTIVGHGGSLRAALARLLPDQFTDWWAYDLHNACLSMVEHTAEGAALRVLNDCSHLDVVTT